MLEALYDTIQSSMCVWYDQRLYHITRNNDTFTHILLESNSSFLFCSNLEYNRSIYIYDCKISSNINNQSLDTNIHRDNIQVHFCLIESTSRHNLIVDDVSRSYFQSFNLRQNILTPHSSRCNEWRCDFSATWFLNIQNQAFYVFIRPYTDI